MCLLNFSISQNLVQDILATPDGCNFVNGLGGGWPNVCSRTHLVGTGHNCTRLFRKQSEKTSLCYWTWQSVCVCVCVCVCECDCVWACLCVSVSVCVLSRWWIFLKAIPVLNTRRLKRNFSVQFKFKNFWIKQFSGIEHGLLCIDDITHQNRDVLFWSDI